MTNNGLAGSFYDAKYILVNSKVLRLDHGNMWKCKISFSGTSNLLPLFIFGHKQMWFEHLAGAPVKNDVFRAFFTFDDDLVAIVTLADESGLVWEDDTLQLARAFNY